jgi:hypothetical protein
MSLFTVYCNAFTAGVLLGLFVEKYLEARESLLQYQKERSYLEPVFVIFPDPSRGRTPSEDSNEEDEVRETKTESKLEL